MLFIAGQGLVLLFSEGKDVPGKTLALFTPQKQKKLGTKLSLCYVGLAWSDHGSDRPQPIAQLGLLVSWVVSPDINLYS